MIGVSVPHVHEWSNDTLYCHCLHCGITLRAYIEWLERMAAALSEINYLTEPNAILAEMIFEAQHYAVGCDLAHVV